MSRSSRYFVEEESEDDEEGVEVGRYLESDDLARNDMEE